MGLGISQLVSSIKKSRLVNETNEYKKKVETLKQELIIVTYEYNVVQLKNFELNMELENITNTNKLLQERHNELKKNNSELLKYNKKLIEIQETLNKTITNLTKEIEELENKYNTELHKTKKYNIEISSSVIEKLMLYKELNRSNSLIATLNKYEENEKILINKLENLEKKLLYMKTLKEKNYLSWIKEHILLESTDEPTDIRKVDLSLVKEANLFIAIEKGTGITFGGYVPYSGNSAVLFHFGNSLKCTTESIDIEAIKNNMIMRKENVCWEIDHDMVLSELQLYEIKKHNS